MKRIALNLILGCNFLATATSFAQSNTPPAAPIYRLDLSALDQLDLHNPANARTGWDTLQLASAIQGIANRDGANVFIRYQPETDDFWWNYLRNENGWLKGRPVIELHNVDDLLRQFAPQLKGVVLYDEHVAATANIADTIAGVEDKIPLRYDTNAASLYTELSKLPEFPKDVLKLCNDDGSPMFTGIGNIPGTNVPSTGSAKNDAYRWAQMRYLDAGRCSRQYLAYYIDSFWLTNPTLGGLANATLANHDFFISHRAFFFDLGVYGDETPNDDPGQKPGTDRATLISIFRSMNHQSDSSIMTIGGFVPWLWKYVGPTGTGPNDFKGSGGKHHPVHNEWEMARIASAFNFVVDADAVGHACLANASFYEHFPLKKHYAQNPHPTIASLKARGLIQPNGRVKDAAYITFYMGDYDSSAWLAASVPKLWADPQHGKIACNWAFDPNLDHRVPQALDYVRTHQSTNDWFISGDCGAGYLNPGMLRAPRFVPSVPDGWDTWTEYNREYYDRYDLTITGFIIEGFGPPMGRKGFDMYRTFSPDGLMIETSSRSFGMVGFHERQLPYIRHRLDLDGTPEQAGATLIAQIEKEKAAFAYGPQFLMTRTILKSPTWHTDVMNATKSISGGERVEFVDVYSFFLLLKTYLSQPH